MIFKQLFAPKHQHTDPKKRIDAISTLDTAEADDKVILLELALRDNHAKVRLAALQALSDLAVWWQASCNDKDEMVKRHAERFIQTTIVDGDATSLTLKDRIQFVTESDSHALKEQCVLSPEWQKETETTLSLLNQLSKPALQQQIMLTTSNSQIQYQLLTQIDDQSVLEKIVKKIKEPSNKQYVVDKLDAFHSQQQALLQHEKSARLVLSKLLALAEQNDYQHIKSTQQTLLTAYNSDIEQLSVLRAEVVTELQTKFESIQGRIEGLLARLLPAYQEAVIKQDAADKQRQVIAQATITSAEVKAVLANDATAITLGQLESLQQRLQSAVEQVGQLKVSAEGEAVLAQLQSTLHTLNKLPSFQQAIEQAKQILEIFKALELPADIAQMPMASDPLKAFKKQWRELSQPYGELWPTELSNSYAEAVKPWNKTINDYQQSIREQSEKIRGLLRTIDNMIKQGRYKVAMGLNEKLQRWWLKLPEFYHAKLNRQYQQVSEKVAELKDLQSYIAAPRKPALIEEVTALVKSPLKIEQQAQTLKKLRAEFNALGKHDNDDDRQLNASFDSVCEQAFEPCRLHYQQLEKQRSDNYQQKVACLESLEALATSNISVSDLSKSLRQLQGQWRKIGHVDYALLDELNAKYKAAVAPLSQKVNIFFATNAEQKAQLIKQATKLAALENVTEAVDKAKQLQADWKSIGYAGHDNEESLWKAFREGMDVVFNRQKAASEANRDAVDQHIKVIESELSEAMKMVKSAANDSDAEHALATLESTTAEHLSALPEKLQNKFTDKLSAVDDANRLRRKKQEQQRVSDIYHVVFEALEAWDSDVLPEQVEQLPSSWQQSFSAVSGTEYNRNELTVLMEIAADTASPASDKELRQTLQIKVMAARLESGDILVLNELLRAWIGFGPVSQEQQQQITRIRACF